VTEQYLGKTLTKTECETIVYFYDELKMSADLIEYLIEYCVENGHKSIRYIKKVALSWADEQVTTVAEAKAISGQYSKNSYAVLNAYGIKGRAPAASELDHIRRWNDEYGFSVELIVEACNRTMNTIHQPSFDYTEKILKNWMDKGVKTQADVKALDVIHLQEKSAKKKAGTPAAKVTTARNKFNNFDGRKYQNMDELTRRLIETQ
jgi:DnaD/phage-associated family protein